VQSGRPGKEWTGCPGRFRRLGATLEKERACFVLPLVHAINRQHAAARFLGRFVKSCEAR
jgi:hypothetical protein